MQHEQIRLPKGVTVRDPNGDRYVIESLLGKGESSAVYLVRSRRDRQNLFALKEVVHPNKEERERFAFECEILERLRHRALPRVYRVFEHDKLKRVYLLMDYIRGRPLEDLRKEQPEKRFSLPLVLALMAPIVDALSYLHTQNPPVVHRAIKPANIIVPVGAEEAVLVDFGSAKEYVADGTTTIDHPRSPGYAAPEQYGGGTNPRTDIYGLGATLYMLLTGSMPPDAPSRIVSIESEGIDLLKPANLYSAAIPPDIAHALQRALSIRNTDRFETVKEFWQVLHTSCQQEQGPRMGSADTPRSLSIQSVESTTTISVHKKYTAPASKKSGVQFIFPALLVALALGTGLVFHLWSLAILLLCCAGIFLLVLMIERHR